MKSARNSLTKRDGLKALILTIGTSVLYYLQTLIPDWNIPEELKGLISLVATYILKNFFTDDVKVAEKVIKKVEETQRKKDYKVYRNDR